MTPFQQLDYLYIPSGEVASDVRYLTDVLGARVGFAVEGMGSRVAMVELAEGPPRLLLADHLEGDRPILVYRLDDLTKALAALSSAA